MFEFVVYLKDFREWWREERELFCLSSVDLSSAMDYSMSESFWAFTSLLSEMLLDAFCWSTASLSTFFYNTYCYLPSSSIFDFYASIPELTYFSKSCTFPSILSTVWRALDTSTLIYLTATSATTSFYLSKWTSNSMAFFHFLNSWLSKRGVWFWSF